MKVALGFFLLVSLYPHLGTAQVTVPELITAMDASPEVTGGILSPAGTLAAGVLPGVGIMDPKYGTDFSALCTGPVNVPPEPGTDLPGPDVVSLTLDITTPPAICSKVGNICIDDSQCLGGGGS